MEMVWAPWRGVYVRESGGAGSGSEPACFFCRGIAGDRDRENLLVWRRAESVVFLNRFPYNGGHLLVAPIAHLGNLAELGGRALHEPLETLQACVRALDRMVHPDGYNIGLNLGKAAGAGVPGHLHWHVVPRWNGDTNFMPVVAETKVIAEGLEEFYDRFQAHLGE